MVMTFYTRTVEDTLSDLETSQKGLSTQEATRRLYRDGENSIRVKGEPIWKIIIEPFANVFVGVLLVAAVLSIVNDHAVDAIIIGLIIGVSALIYYVQQYATDRVLRALKKHDEQQVQTYRDGAIISVPSQHLVVGDIVVVAEGEKVPADGRIIHAENVRTDEAMLTGESLPVNKHVHALEGDHPVYEQRNMLFQGSFVVAGKAVMVVTTTGVNTEFGKLAELAVPSHNQSPVQHKINQAITVIVIGVGLVSVAVFALALYRGIETTEALRFVMALAVAAIPEGLPVAITVVLVLGMRRLAVYKALARSMKAIETIGVITTIASDKTGTLTQNKLRVQEVWQPNRHVDIHSWSQSVVQMRDGVTSDPLDTALHEYTKSLSTIEGRTLHGTIPFDQAAAMSANVWKVGNHFEVAVKGAPEKLISHAYKASDDNHKKAEHALHSFAAMGYRVIAVGSIGGLTKPPESFQDIQLDKLSLVGLIAVADELRPEAAKSIAEARAAGITVRMITGDHSETAFAIGKKIGLCEHRDQVLDCRAIDKMSDLELKERVADTRVFARVVPEAKHRILTVLKIADITAMTGDGVNDVPALTNAHVGIAMGSGSQIAKDAGDIVLLDDNFSTIVRAVEGGRTIIDNIRRMLAYVLTTSLGGVMTMIGALVLNLPLPVVAVQILWVNLVTDTLFAIPLGLEKAEENVMQRPPRGVNQPLLDRHYIERMILLALVMAVTVLVIFWWFLQDNSIDYARTIAFGALVVMQWANALNSRSEYMSLWRRLRVKNTPFYVGFTIAAMLQTIALFGPLAAFLYVVPVDFVDVTVACLVGFAIIIVFGEIHKALTRMRLHR